MAHPKTYKRTIPGTIALCLVFIVLLCYTGGLVVWNVAREISYEYVRSYGNELKFRDTITVSAETIKGNEELNWVRHDEIRYHGQMYDIKKQISLDNGKIMLVGYFDSWDSDLFSELERLLEPSPGQTPQNENEFFWLADAVLPGNHLTSATYPKIILRHFSKDGQHFHLSYSPDIPVPPPNVCFA
ncbi:hypothetical protein [Polluticoccus soli]|uniref:hypothetical protein n=1 Tax=Polluticoccus soli TaxID=3034150 RepID=UPI0023E240A8|nr:hypothetical protein [Flavipsychrobacter sp. JY13-12]